MHLTPKETDRLLVFLAAQLARRRLERGCRLNVPEAIALISDEVMERAWDGLPVSEVAAAGRQLLTSADVMEGVADVVRHLEVDCLFPSGSSLVAIDDPIAPSPLSSPTERASHPGAIRTTGHPIVANSGRRTIEVTVTNPSAQPVAVSSHYPFDQVNKALQFDREASQGMRLDVAAGSTTMFAPGETKSVRLVEISGGGFSRFATRTDDSRQWHD